MELRMTDHGGKRKGAGRKASPDERKIPLTIKMDRGLFEYLSAVESKTATIEAALRRSKGFRDWLAKRRSEATTR
jgi:hypothetical protein